MSTVLTDANRLSVCRPDVAAEWDYIKNKGLTPHNISYRSGRAVYWKCLACGESYVEKIRNKTRYSVGSRPHRLCGCNRLSDLYPESLLWWDGARNGGVQVCGISYASNKKFWWRCRFCGCGWASSPNNMAAFFSGAPRRRLCDCNRLSVVRPDVAVEWCYDKNAGLTPAQVTFSANKKAWWVCGICGNRWQATINSRCSSSHPGCPWCSGLRVSDKNRLSTCFPEVAQDWDYDKNPGNTPNNVSVGGPKADWVCKKCGYRWVAYIYNRCNGGKGCPKCSRGNVSEASQKWLDSLCVPVESREAWVFIGPNKKLKVDAYIPETNTVYEFLGDYWHGNPAVFDSDKVNSNNKKTFGRLFDETLERLNTLRSGGYNLNVIWEDTFKRLQRVDNGS